MSTESDRQAFAAVVGKRYEDAPTAWNRVLRITGLGLDYQPAVDLVLRQGRWGSADNPAAYVLIAARREYGKLAVANDEHTGFADLPSGVDIPENDRADVIQFRHDEASGNYGDDEFYDINNSGTGFPGPGGRPFSLDALKLDGERLAIDWERVADKAGLDEGERNVLEMRLEGLTRDVLLKICRGDKEAQKELQASWRRLSYKFPLIKKALSEGTR